MKNSRMFVLILSIMMAGFIVSPVAPPVAAQEIGIEESAQFMNALVMQLKSLLVADNVLGTPIEHNGMQIIPIVSYGFGFGGGSGMGGMHEQGSGAAGGGGGGVMPISFLVISADGDLRIIEAEKGELGEIIKAVSPMLIEAIKSGSGQQQQEEKPSPMPGEEQAEPETQQP